jgi:SAM-dependent methyltransferase
VPKAGIPDRIVWAVEALDVRPSDHMLEIGCGRGLAAPLVCEKLGRGTLTAIDRSKAAIMTANHRNASLVASGKVRFGTVALAEADFGNRRFSKIFAINVNLFWLDPARELSVVHKLLRSSGGLYLIYEPPSPDQLKRIGARLARNLKEGGFGVDMVISGRPTSARALCVIARPSRSIQ